MRVGVTRRTASRIRGVSEPSRTAAHQASLAREDAAARARADRAARRGVSENLREAQALARFANRFADAFAARR